MISICQNYCLLQNIWHQPYTEWSESGWELHKDTCMFQCFILNYCQITQMYHAILGWLMFVMPYPQCKTYSKILMQALCSVWRSVSPETYSWSAHSQWQRRLPVDLPWHYVWWTETWDMSSCVGSHLCSSTVSQSSTCWWRVTWNFYNRRVSQRKLSVCEISLSKQGLCDFSLPLWSSWELRSSGLLCSE